MKPRKLYKSHVTYLTFIPEIVNFDVNVKYKKIIETAYVNLTISGRKAFEERPRLNEKLNTFFRYCVTNSERSCFTYIQGVSKRWNKLLFP